MKKRILSLILASSMLIVSSMAAFAEPLDIGDTADEVYEGNKPFVLAEKLLDELNNDKEADIFDQDGDGHKSQYRKIKEANDDVLSLTTDDLSNAINLVTTGMSDAQKMYLYAQVRAEDDDAFKTELDAVDFVGDLPLRESFGLLDNYIDDMKIFLNAKGISADDYNNDLTVQQRARAIVAEPLKAILKVMFAKDGTAEDAASYTDSGEFMRENYLDEFIANDRAKKTLAVLFGAELTKELVTDSFLPGVGNNTPGETEGIVHHVKKYLSENSSALADVKSNVENNVLNPSAGSSVRGAFDTLGELVVAAYEYDTQASDNLKAGVKMLMGDGEDEGLIELIVNAVDPSHRASNIWINLFLSEFVQTNITNGDTLYTVSAETPHEGTAKIKNGTYVTFKNENLSDYGIEDERISLRTGKFTLDFYVEDPSYVAPSPGGSSPGGSFGGGGGGGFTPGSEPTYNERYIKSEYITYDSDHGKILVDRDATRSDEYEAYMVLYRSDVASGNTFIESYPVTVVNKSSSTGGGGSTRYSVKYETNGGEPISSEYYVKGATVQLTAVPVREGYIFEGWYSDAALTQKVESVVMDGNITVYAKWTKDGSSVVSKVDVPQQLNGDEHFAYVIGYPEGDVRPQNNITRAEAVTILFRLLKDDVRNANVTDVNVFADVNEGDWYNKAVSTLAALEIVNGRTETEFMPNEYITRAEFATIFARFCEFSYTVTDEFKDIDGHWAENYVNEAAAYGWIAGYEDNTFRPDNRITRAEAMTLINRVLKRNPENTNDLLEGMSVWTDNADTSAWYYIAVQEATNSHEYIKKNDSYETWTKLTQNRDWTTYEK